MKVYATIAVILIVVGVLALVYTQFSYTKESESATLGPLQLTINEKKTVNIPVWVGGGSIVLGAGMLVFALMKHKAIL